MRAVSELSSRALYAKAKAMFVPHLSEEAYAELASFSQLSDFTAYLKSKTPYAEAFEAVGAMGRLSRRQIEGVVKRMSLMRLERLNKYALLCDNGVSEYFLRKHECECIVRRLRQSGAYELDSYFMYIPDGFFKKTSFDLYALERASAPQDVLEVLKGTVYEKPLSRLLTEGAENGHQAPENLLYAGLYERGAAEFKKKLAPGEYAEVEKLLATLGDMLTISTLYRIKKYYPQHEDTLKLHVYRSKLTRLSEREYATLVHTETPEAFINTLENGVYKKAAELLRGSHAAFFSRQYIYDVCRKTFASSTNAALTALCYSVCNAAEADNLILLAEGIGVGADPDEMLSLLIR